MSDPGKYRTKEEVEQMMQFDPLHLFAKRLMEQERVTEPELSAMDKEVLEQIEECVRYTEQSPYPSPESLYEDVYVRSPYVNMKAAEKDPAWRASVREDRVPEEFPAFTPGSVKVES
jgi:pyruvate dehydrogenase E1 component alpha subunit